MTAELREMQRIPKSPAHLVQQIEGVLHEVEELTYDDGQVRPVYDNARRERWQ